jgi:hypothetical protein
VAQVRTAVQAWAEAWSRKDVAAYFASYTPGFGPGGRSAWMEDRRARILGKRSILVRVNDLNVSVDGASATARFRQDYLSDSLSTTSRKSLKLVRSAAGKWLIEQENVGS